MANGDLPSKTMGNGVSALRIPAKTMMLSRCPLAIPPARLMSSATPARQLLKDPIVKKENGKKELATPLSSNATTSAAKKRIVHNTPVPDVIHLRNIADMMGLAFSMENGDKTEFDFLERIRRFHDKLRKFHDSDDLPQRAGSNWQWKQEDVKKAISFVVKNLDGARHTVSFFGCAGPEGVHICYHSSLKPPLIHTDDQKLHMRLFSHDAVRTPFEASCTHGLNAMAHAIRQAPFGRWYFIGGKLPSDWQVLRDCLLAEEFHVPEEGVYIVVFGCKGSPDVKVLRVGSEEVLVDLRDTTVRSCERIERRTCGNCQNPIYLV